jgi:hypothetical protein
VQILDTLPLHSHGGPCIGQGFLSFSNPRISTGATER